jgi:hypothetical protein
MDSSFFMFLYQTLRTRVGRTPLDERSARRRDFYLSTHNTHNKQTGIRTHNLSRRATADLRAATGTGTIKILDEQKLAWEEETVHWYIVTSLLLKPMKQHLIDVIAFRLSKLLYSRSVPFKRTNNLYAILSNRWDRRIYEIKFPTDVSLLFFLSIFCFSH